MPIISGGSGGGAISGVTVTGTAVSGEVPVASNSSAGAWGFPPGFEVGYDQITGSVTITSTTEASPTTVIACAAHVFDGAPVLLTVFIPNAQMTTAGDDLVIPTLFESTTQITRLGVWAGPFASTGDVSLSMQYRFTPSAGSHTYIIGAHKTGAATAILGCGVAGTGAYSPAFARFTKV